MAIRVGLAAARAAGVRARAVPSEVVCSFTVETGVDARFLGVEIQLEDVEPISFIVGANFPAKLGWGQVLNTISLLLELNESLGVLSAQLGRTSVTDLDETVDCRDSLDGGGNGARACGLSAHFDIIEDALEFESCSGVVQGVAAPASDVDTQKPSEGGVTKLLEVVGFTLVHHAIVLKTGGETDGSVVEVNGPATGANGGDHGGGEVGVLLLERTQKSDLGSILGESLLESPGKLEEGLVGGGKGVVGKRPGWKLAALAGSSSPAAAIGWGSADHLRERLRHGNSLVVKSAFNQRLKSN